MKEFQIQILCEIPGFHPSKNKSTLPIEEAGSTLNMFATKVLGIVLVFWMDQGHGNINWCPSSCQCTGRIIACERKGLTSMPYLHANYGIHNKRVYWLLKHNLIERVSADILPFIHVVDLRKNPIICNQVPLKVQDRIATDCLNYTPGAATATMTPTISSSTTTTTMTTTTTSSNSVSTQAGSEETSESNTFPPAARKNSPDSTTNKATSEPSTFVTSRTVTDKVATSEFGTSESGTSESGTSESGSDATITTSLNPVSNEKDTSTVSKTTRTTTTRMSEETKETKQNVISGSVKLTTIKYQDKTENQTTKVNINKQEESIKIDFNIIMYTSATVISTIITGILLFLFRKTLRNVTRRVGNMELRARVREEFGGYNLNQNQNEEEEETSFGRDLGRRLTRSLQRLTTFGGANSGQEPAQDVPEPTTRYVNPFRQRPQRGSRKQVR